MKYITYCQETGNIGMMLQSSDINFIKSNLQSGYGYIEIGDTQPSMIEKIDIHTKEMMLKPSSPNPW